ncbi:hypothetical protein WJX81_004017 [Elliptochloris bilobata]|uniref:UDENN domain-containing protein n=1 Tax=Elliptochloris bilobata TaxID=381761 RepID=A0AAW1RLD7_9CHLO
MEAPRSLRVERTAASAPAHSREVTSPAEHDEPSKLKGSRGSGSKLNQATKAFRNLNPFKRQNTADRWFNPEEATAQKRAWAKQFSEGEKVLGWPSQFFENFIIVGVPPHTEVKSALGEPDLVHRAKSGEIRSVAVTAEAAKEREHRGAPRGQPLAPQVLFAYPPGKPVTPDAAAFCFPHGVQPALLERTPSLSALNELVCSQAHTASDAASFIFTMKVADDLPLYGVCCYMDELVARPPSVLRAPGDAAPELPQFLVSAPRCYCLLTHYPFFPLHMKVLHLLRSQSMRPAAGPAAAGSGASALEVVQAYLALRVPAPGEALEFVPDDGLQPVHFLRPKAASAGARRAFAHRAAIAAAEAEAAAGLRPWAVAALARALSLDNIVTLLTCALLERQVVVFCPNIGVLSTVVLALVPMLQPFAWQSLLLPVLPTQERLLEILEAPVPFILGVQYKTAEVAARCGGLTRVNVYKDRITLAKPGGLPALPHAASLAAALAPVHRDLAALGRERHRPLYNVSAEQAALADTFLQVVQEHNSRLCADLHLHTITDVQTSERVSLLLKDSFVESFPQRERPFMKQFVETQIFSVFVDSVIK